MIGPYEIRGELGRGAMAVVWRGYDSAIGREVALKEPKIDDSLDPATREELIARFIREGRTAGKLNHPGIVTIYNAELIDGRPIIAMELIEGETLSSLLRRGRLPVGAAIGIAEQLLDALAYAHARGVVHRDIKPDNVFVTDDGRIKLTDFGIAHAGGGTALTQAGTVMGTPGYMAPEQVRGEAVDARADLFSVGVVLFEMLAGDNPFMAGDAHPTTIMYRVLNEALPDVRTALPEVSEGLAATIAVATAKDAEGRFGSAEDMRRALLGEVGVAMPKAVKPEGRRRSKIVWMTLTAVVLLGGLFIWMNASSVPAGEVRPAATNAQSGIAADSADGQSETEALPPSTGAPVGGAEDLVRRYIDAVNSGDAAAAMSMFDVGVVPESDLESFRTIASEYWHADGAVLEVSDIQVATSDDGAIVDVSGAFYNPSDDMASYHSEGFTVALSWDGSAYRISSLDYKYID